MVTDIFGAEAIMLIPQDAIKKISEYIRNQLNEDIINDQMTFKEYFDPLTGSKNN